MSLQVLIDDFIAPLLLEATPVFDGLLRFILLMAGICLIGVISGFTYNRIMVVISQGVLKKSATRCFHTCSRSPLSISIHILTAIS